jgi:predicted deacylase
MGFPYIWRLPLRSGVLSCEAMRAGIPATGAELGGGSRCLRQHVEQYYGAVKNILRTWGMLADASQPYPEQRVVYGDWILAPASGYFESRVKLEHAVNEGEEIATIYGIENSVQARILAPCNGRVLGVRTYPSIYEGDSAIFVVSEGDRPSMPADVH